MSLKEILESSADSDEIFYVRMYDIANKGFYKLNENKLKFSEYQQRLEKGAQDEAMFVGYLIMKGKAIMLRHKDQFEIDTETKQVRLYVGEYEKTIVEESSTTIQIVDEEQKKREEEERKRKEEEDKKKQEEEQKKREQEEKERLAEEERKRRHKIIDDDQNKGLPWGWIILVLLVILAIGGGAFVYMKRVSTKKHDI